MTYTLRPTADWRVSIYRDLAMAVLAFGLIYWNISHFQMMIGLYHAAISNSMLLTACLLVLPFLLRPANLTQPPIRALAPWIALGLTALAATLFAEYGPSAFARLKLYFSMFMLALAFRLWLEKPTDRTVSLILLAFGIAHLAALIPVIHSSIHPPPLPASLPFHGNIRHVAYHGMTAAASGLVLVLVGGKLRLAGFFIGTAALFGLLHLGSRGALLGWLTFLISSFWLLAGHRKRFAIAALTMLTLAGGTSQLAEEAGFHSPFSEPLQNRAGTIEKLTYTSGRMAIWQGSIESVMERPLLGFGPEGFFRTKGKTPTRVQPHNAIVQALVEFGFIGFFVLVWLLYKVAYQPLKRIYATRQNPGQGTKSALLMSMIVGTIAYSMLDGLFYHGIPLLIFAILSAITYATYNAEFPDETISKPKGC